MYFGAIAGVQINRFNQQFIVDAASQMNSFAIGAGSAFTKNNFVGGLEFVYASGRNSNDNGETQYVGFSNTFFGGYNISKSNTWKIEPTAGIVLSNHQLIVQNESGSRFQNFANNPLLGTISLNIKNVGSNGLFTGAKLGYNFPFSGETEWKNKVGDTASGLSDNMGSFYIQVNIGGFLSFAR